MERPVPIVRVRGLLGLVACAAVNLWLFRLGLLPGLIGLNVTKHVAIAALCRGAGVNRRPEGGGPAPPGQENDPARPGVWTPGITPRAVVRPSTRDGEG